MSTEPPNAFRTFEEPQPADHEFDPLRICIFTTIGLIAWLITPPLTVAIFGTTGVVAYFRARRRGLTNSRCLLGDTRIVIGYLAVLAAAGIAATTWRFLS